MEARSLSPTTSNDNTPDQLARLRAKCWNKINELRAEIKRLEQKLACLDELEEMDKYGK